MGKILDHLDAMARRAADPSPAAGPIAAALKRGKREQLLTGRDAAGHAFPPAAPATLRRSGRGPGPVLVPDGDASRLIRDYTVSVTIQPGRIECSAGWPGLEWVRYLRSGTRRMPIRDPGGFRAEDLDGARAILREYIASGRNPADHSPGRESGQA